MEELSFFETVERRVSTRAFAEKQIDPEKLQKLLETVNSAPSAGNLQSYKIVVVKKPEIKKLLVDACRGQEFIQQAPVVLVFLADSIRPSARYGERGSSLYSIQDATIAAAYSQLAATALGLSSVWVGAFDEKEVARIVRAMNHERPVAVIPIGYAAETPEKHGRRELKEMVQEL